MGSTKKSTSDQIITATSEGIAVFTWGVIRGAGVAVGIFWVAKKFGVLKSLENLSK
jgi:hypothetical protein